MSGVFVLLLVAVIIIAQNHCGKNDVRVRVAAGLAVIAIIIVLMKLLSLAIIIHGR
jgi:hypothetical protein